MLEYIEEGHLYLYNGVILPSVTQMLQVQFPDKYNGVPEYILNNKAEYGSKVHKAVELLEEYGEYEVDNNFYIELSIEQWLNLKKKYNIDVREQEQLIVYEDKYAGRFDMIAMVEDDYCLCDIKTTAELDKEYISWQLSLYELATGVKFDKLYAIWLPKKDLAKLVEVERKSKEELLDLIQRVRKYYE